MEKYLFKSSRLGFRTWQKEDIDKMAAINMDKEVMEFFPTTRTYGETVVFVDRMTIQFILKGYCYFAVDILADKSFIGFIGFSEQNYQADFTPCIDIGWRLAKTAWHHGYATEGAMRCLEYGFETLHLEKVYSITPVVNTKSEGVMKNIGMQKVKTFSHPQLLENARLRNCNLYIIEP